MKVLHAELLLICHSVQISTEDNSDSPHMERIQHTNTQYGGFERKTANEVLQRKTRMAKDSWSSDFELMDKLDRIDASLQSYFDYEKKYKIVRMLLMQKLTNVTEEQIDGIVESQFPHEEVKKEPPKVLLEGRNYINAPCFSNHMSYVLNSQEAGCANAVEFVNKVCSDFRACMDDAGISYWHCKPSICHKLKTMPTHDRCLDYLFKCE